MRECDLIMKGGITSGVVYPFAITEIAKTFRLKDIGGTSAGAIGAVFAASAEYRRQTEAEGLQDKGFLEIEKLAAELGEDMQSLFQPEQPLAPLFGILLTLINAPAGKSKGVALIWAAVKACRWTTAAALVIGAVIIIWGFVSAGVWAIVCGVVAIPLLGLLGAGGCVAYDVLVRLPAHDFGICSGKTQPGNKKPGFSDWIADKIDIIAGNVGSNGQAGDPLTIGQLKQKGIGIATMTTDLSSQRPYQLPMHNRLHYFSKAEFGKLFPKRIVDYLVRTGGRFEARDPKAPGDLYRLPHGNAFPVLLVARMSLSFPGLIRAVPLYRVDYGVELDPGSAGGGTEKRYAIRRCLFSDGGLSSNFPIHFFDSLLPTRPTFGIALASWEEARHGTERVKLTEQNRQSTDVPVRTIGSLGAFLFSMINTAKDWQDSLTSLLPGYADRIVEVRLDDAREGGLNLTMSKEIIEELAEYGRQAGRKLVTEFRFDRHRYIRGLFALSKTEALLDKVRKHYHETPSDGGDPYEKILTEYVIPDNDDGSPRYENEEAWRRDALDRMAKALSQIPAAPEDADRRIAEGNVPSGDARVGIIAIADRVPESDSDADQ